MKFFAPGTSHAFQYSLFLEGLPDPDLSVPNLEHYTEGDEAEHYAWDFQMIESDSDGESSSGKPNKFKDNELLNLSLESELEIEAMTVVEKMISDSDSRKVEPEDCLKAVISAMGEINNEYRCDEGS